MATINIRVHMDHETQHWVATCEELPGLSVSGIDKKMLEEKLSLTLPLFTDEIINITENNNTTDVNMTITYLIGDEVSLGLYCEN